MSLVNTSLGDMADLPTGWNAFYAQLRWHTLRPRALHEPRWLSIQRVSERFLWKLHWLTEFRAGL